MGIGDEYQWIHIEDDCPAYECLTDTYTVKNALNSSFNESVAENDDNDSPPSSPKISEAIEAMDSALQWL